MTEGQMSYLLADIGDHPLLTATEERELARTYRAGKDTQASPSEIAAGEEARQRLIALNLKLVVSRAKKWFRKLQVFPNGTMELEDFIQNGFLGLIEHAVEKYDPERGIRFATYATWWIFHAMQRGLDDIGPTIRIPVFMLDRRRLLTKAQDQLQQELGREKISAEELARATGFSERAVTFVSRLPWAVSLDEPDPFLEREAESIASTEKLEEESLQRISSANLMRTARRVLTPIQFEVIRLRYVEDLRLQEIGNQLGFSRQRANQYEKEALQVLRDHLERHGSD